MKRKFISVRSIMNDISAEQDYLTSLKDDVAKSERRLRMLGKLLNVLHSNDFVIFDCSIYYDDCKLECFLKPYFLEDELKELKQKVSSGKNLKKK